MEASAPPTPHPKTSLTTPNILLNAFYSPEPKPTIDSILSAYYDLYGPSCRLTELWTRDASGLFYEVKVWVDSLGFTPLKGVGPKDGSDHVVEQGESSTRAKVDAAGIPTIQALDSNLSLQTKAIALQYKVDFLESLLERQEATTEGREKMMAEQISSLHKRVESMLVWEQHAARMLRKQCLRAKLELALFKLFGPYNPGESVTSRLDKVFLPGSSWRDVNKYGKLFSETLDAIDMGSTGRGVKDLEKAGYQAWDLLSKSVHHPAPSGTIHHDSYNNPIERIVLEALFQVAGITLPVVEDPPRPLWAIEPSTAPAITGAPLPIGTTSAADAHTSAPPPPATPFPNEVPMKDPSATGPCAADHPLAAINSVVAPAVSPSVTSILATDPASPVEQDFEQAVVPQVSSAVGRVDRSRSPPPQYSSRPTQKKAAKASYSLPRDSHRRLPQGSPGGRSPRHRSRSPPRGERLIAGEDLDRDLSLRNGGRDHGSSRQRRRDWGGRRSDFQDLWRPEQKYRY